MSETVALTSADGLVFPAYAHAQHGFSCDQRGSHDPAAAALALQRALAFFFLPLA